MDTAYILDTNIILDDPYIITKLEKSNIYIDYVVLQELDKLKKDEALSLSVRIFTNIINKAFHNNYILENGSKIIFDNVKINKTYLDSSINDNRIISLAINKKEKYKNVFLLTNDNLMSIIAREHGLNVINNNIGEDKKLNYKGYVEYYLEKDLINKLYNEKKLDIKYINDIIIYPHMFLILKNYNSSNSTIAKVNRDCTKIELIKDIKSVWGIKHKNVQQLMALNLLLDDNIPLVVLEGSAGSGKTLLTLASALYLTADYSNYESILLFKPTPNSADDDLGFLPGDVMEKLNPYYQSFYDNLKKIVGDEYNSDFLKLKIEALNYMRGRTIDNSFIFIDEFQNVLNKTSKTYITRTGVGSKLVLSGDITQIDNPKISKYNNGLSHVIDRFLGDEDFGYIRFDNTNVIRSKISKKAVEKL